jgi:DNA-binding NtrC family response regulator
MKERASIEHGDTTGQPADARAQLLVVDDDPDVCEVVRAVLEREGYAVTTETTARHALERLVSGRYELVLSDISMPETDGISLCREMTARCPGVPIVLVTAHADMETVTGALRVGARDFLTKPLDMAALRATVARLLAEPAPPPALPRASRPERAAGVASLLGESGAMRDLRRLILDLRDSVASVVIQGETGTGKELIAQALHVTSRMSQGPFVALNCAAMPAGLLESELFGHAKGAFTDAHSAKKGLLLQADRGTLLLDEIGDLPLSLQPKLLRALQERTVRPVGEHREIPFNCRLVCAANQDLELAVNTKRFREDLYYRLDVVRIVVPPLRARGADVLLLAQHFMERFARKTQRVVSLSEPAAAKLLAYDWPGNVRELENCMERALALTRHSLLMIEDLPEKVRRCETRAEQASAALGPGMEPVSSLFEAERNHVLRTVRELGGNKTRAAALLGIDRRTLYRRLQRYEESSH